MPKSVGGWESPDRLWFEKHPVPVRPGKGAASTISKSRCPVPFGKLPRSPDVLSSRVYDFETAYRIQSVVSRRRTKYNVRGASFVALGPRTGGQALAVSTAHEVPRTSFSAGRAKTSLSVTRRSTAYAQCNVLPSESFGSRRYIANSKSPVAASDSVDRSIWERQEQRERSDERLLSLADYPVVGIAIQLAFERLRCELAVLESSAARLDPRLAADYGHLHRRIPEAEELDYGGLDVHDCVLPGLSSSAACLEPSAGTTACLSPAPTRCSLLQACGGWLRLGIAIERIKPGHPRQNGRHEQAPDVKAGSGSAAQLE